MPAQKEITDLNTNFPMAGSGSEFYSEKLIPFAQKSVQNNTFTQHSRF